MSSDQPLRTSVAADLGSLAAAFAVRSASPVVLPTGTEVGRFVIEAELGRGGMGSVYRAHDLQLDRRVAIKLGLAGTDLARARREAVALARLAHPNVVTIYEIGEHEGIPFVAMELCEGGTVRAWTLAAPRTWREVLAVYLAAGRGLGAAHAAGLVHRDVKPDNILLGADGRARIADFGLARGAAGLRGGHPADSRPVLTEEAVTVGPGTVRVRADATPSPTPSPSPDAVVTATGALVGTPRYMAPEQFDGGEIDARTDQFAYCVALYEALAGVDPFPASPTARIEAMATSRISAPLRGRSVPGHVLAVVERGLSPRPAGRFATMDELLAALVRTSRPWRRRLAAAIGAAVVAVAAAVAIGVAFVPGRAERVTAGAAGGCAELAADLVPGWSSAARTAFIAGNSAAGETAPWAAAELDQEVQSLAAARAALCLARRAAEAQTAAADRVGGVNCLAQTAAELARVVALRGRKPGELIGALGQLVATASCEYHQSGRSASTDRTGPVWHQIAAAEALAVDGQGDAALAGAEQARRAAQVDGSAIILARAEFALVAIHRHLRRGEPRTRVFEPAARPEPGSGAHQTVGLLPGSRLVDPAAVPSLVAVGGDLHVFARSTTGTLVTASWQGGSGPGTPGTWTAVVPIVATGAATAETIAGDPVAVTVDGRLEVFYRQAGTSNFMHAVHTPAGWSVTNRGGWVGRVGTTVTLSSGTRLTFTTPDTAMYPWFDQRVWIAVTGAEDPPSTDWQILPEHVADGARPSAVFSPVADRIDVVALDNRGHVAWHTREGAAFGATRWLWRPPSMPPGVALQDPILISTADDRAGVALAVVIRASDGELWLARKRRDEDRFSEFEQLGATSDVQPVVAQREAGRLTVFGRAGAALFAIDVDALETTPRVRRSPVSGSASGAVSVASGAPGAAVLAFTTAGELQHGWFRVEGPGL